MKLFLLLLFPLFVFAQHLSEKERLQNALQQNPKTEEKVKLFTDLSWEYTMTENDSALIYAERALELSKKEDYALGKAVAFEAKGLYYEIVEGNYDLASELYFKGIKICEKNNLDYAASIYHTLGVMFHTSDSYEKGLKYYKIAYDYALKNNNLELQKKCLINMGSVNSTLGNYDTAKDFMLQSLELDIRNEFNFDTYANLGNLLVRQEKIQEALPYLEKASEIHPDNPSSEVNLYFLLYAKAISKDSSNMETVLLRAEKAVKEISGIRDKSLLLRTLADYYTFTENYEKALKYRNEYVTVYEEIKEKQRDETVYELEAQYQTEKTERELERSEADQKLLFFILGSVALLLAITAFFLFKNNKKNKLLAKQKMLLEVSVDEKNVLLKETHHRVKNSFQIVSSLLYLQSENAQDKEAQLAIKEAENRVRSMVLIHQKLYSKEQLVGIDTEEYITDLVNDIFESHQLEAQKIQYSLNVESIVLDVETITPLGLILNELITNVIKHAFPSFSENNRIEINLSKLDNLLLLKVSDNGKGMTGNISEDSFGIQLIKSLAKKLKATLEFSENPRNGTVATLTITRFNEL